MVFLFVGSSALTEASFPRNLAVPQLLLSSAWAMLTLVMRASLTVFPHRGLAPHQFTLMSGAHKAPAPNRRPCFAFAVSREFDYYFCAPPLLSAAVGEARH